MKNKRGKKRKDEKLSILIFKENDYSGVYQKKVPLSSLKFFIITVTLFLTFSFASFYFLYVFYSERTEMLAFSKENIQLKKEIEKYSKKIEEINEKIVYLEQLENKVRDLSQASLGSDVSLSIGGKEIDILKDLSAVSKRKEKQYFDSLNEILIELSTKLEEKEESLSELIDLLEEQKLLSMSTPSILPVKGWISSNFGYRISPFTKERVFHEGLDIAAPYGTPVRATAKGIVIFAGYKAAYGKMVTIDHGFGFVTRYGHNSKLLVKPGDKVEKGDIIALVGSTGMSTGPHCHYEVLVNGIPVNPLNFVVELAEQK